MKADDVIRPTDRPTDRPTEHVRETQLSGVSVDGRLQ